MDRMLTIFLALLVLGGCASSDFEEGVAAYERRDYEAALAEFQPLAKEGEPGAQMMLGRMYVGGEGVVTLYDGDTGCDSFLDV